MESEPDPGIVSIALHLDGAGMPDTLPGELPFERCGDGTDPSLALPWRFALHEDSGIDAAIAELAHVIEGLSARASADWNALAVRSLDVGLTNRPDMTVCRFPISPESMTSLGRLRIELIVTWYWPHSAYEADEDSD